MSSLKEVEKELSAHERFFIFSHMSPEADAIGSQLGLSRILRQLGKKTVLVNQDGLPERLSFIKGSKSINRPSEIDMRKDQPKVAIVVDCANLDRIGDDAVGMLADRKIVNIDHHQDNSHFGDLNLVESFAATTQIIYELTQYLDFKVDPPLATALYAGLMVDTGSFQNSNVDRAALATAAELVDLGADVKAIVKNIYESEPFPKMKLLGRVLGKASFNGDIVWSEVTKELLEETETNMSDTEGIITQLRKTEGAQVACLFKELSNERVKISLRSKDGFNSSKVARSFGGGGHRAAAGFLLEGELEEVERKVIKKLQGEIDG